MDTFFLFSFLFRIMKNIRQNFVHKNRYTFVVKIIEQYFLLVQLWISNFILLSYIYIFLSVIYLCRIEYNRIFIVQSIREKRMIRNYRTLSQN